MFTRPIANVIGHPQPRSPFSMSEENNTPPSQTADASKAETIRITLPPKQEQQAVKRETVRINLPGRPATPAGTTPKKETTKLPGGAAAAPAPPSAPSAP